MKSVTFALMSSILAMTPYTMAVGQGHDGADIHVTAKHDALVDWTRRTGKLLSDQLRYPTIMIGRQEGMVMVKFLCSDAGTPSQVALLKSSGSSQLDSAAIRGVSRIKTLHPLPSGLEPSQQYVATILFATDQNGYAQQLRKLESRQRDSNKWFDKSASTLAMGIGLLNKDGRIALLN